MTDRRRQTWPARPGRPAITGDDARPRVVVVGGRIAGLAAATGLAERGVAVDVIERQAYLGGRVGGWTETLVDGSQTGMNRGFHAFFRQYYNLRALLRRGDPALSALTPVSDYPLIDGAGRQDTFRGLPQTPPLNALAFALRSPTFRLRDLVRIDAKAAAPLAAVSVPDTYRQLDHRDAQTFLRDINFPDAARHRVRGVRPQLLRPARGTVGWGTGHDVPHLLPGLQRGPHLRRREREFRCGPVESAS